MAPVAGARWALPVVLRRKWTILAPVLVVPVALVLLAFWQGPRFEATAEVLVTPAEEAGGPGQAEPDATTEAELARVREVAESTVRTAGLADRSADDLLAASTVTPVGGSNLLRFSVSDPVEQAAVRLANAYAGEYVAYRGELGSAASASAVVVEEARNAEQVQPRPVRSAIAGVALGLALGIALALLWEVLDVRIRSAADVAARLGVPLLGRLPVSASRRRAPERRPVARDAAAGALRALAANLDLEAGSRDAHTVMFTSQYEREDKSTTVADLALLLAGEGRRVAMVDLDLRRPRLTRRFGLEGKPGVTSVLARAHSLDEALARAVPSGATRPPASPPPGALRSSELFAELLAIRSAGGAREASNGAGGTLQVLPAGPTPPGASELVRSERLADLFGELRRRADLVLVDGPPLSHADEARAVSAHVDGVVLVTPQPVPGSALPDELRRALADVPAEKLGVVVTGT